MAEHHEKHLKRSSGDLAHITLFVLFLICLLAAGCQPCMTLKKGPTLTDEENIRWHIETFSKPCGKLATFSDMECLKSMGWSFTKSYLFERFQPVQSQDLPIIWEGTKDTFEYLKATYQPGDEVWKFSSPPATWHALAGIKGFIILRQENVVAEVITILN